MNINTNKEYIRRVAIKEIKAKSILRKHKKIDSWFISQYGMNFYRGCNHNCVYCDGRSEGYYVEGKFGKDVLVKINAIDLLRRELDPKRKRIPLKRCYIMLGGGVGDSYQPIEKKYQLSRKALHVIHHFNFPVSILTKSTLVERDLDIIKKINEKNRAIVSFSFSSTDEKISSIFEPGVPPPKDRLETLKLFKNEGIACGMFLLPVIPFATDTSKIIEETIKQAKEIDLDFIIFGGMTLKEGRQKNYYYDILKNYDSNLITKYKKIYKKDRWGHPGEEYYKSLHLTFSRILKKYKIPCRIPPRLFNDILSENDLVVVILEQIDYLLKMERKKSPFGYAAYSISKLTEPLAKIKNNLRQLKGVGPTTERIILEILETGTSAYYEKLLYG